MKLLSVLLAIFFTACAIKEPKMEILQGGCDVKEIKKDIGIVLDFDIVDDEIAVIGGESEYKKVYPDISDYLKICILKYTGACLYPWECMKKPSKIFNVHIESIFYDKRSDRFVAVYTIEGKEFIVKRSFKTLEEFLRYLSSQIGRYILSKSS